MKYSFKCTLQYIDLNDQIHSAISKISSILLMKSHKNILINNSNKYYFVSIDQSKRGLIDDSSEILTTFRYR